MRTDYFGLMHKSILSRQLQKFGDYEKYTDYTHSAKHDEGRKSVIRTKLLSFYPQPWEPLSGTKEKFPNRSSEILPS